MDLLFFLGRIVFGGFFIKNALNHFKNQQALAGYAASKGVPHAEKSVLATGAMLLLGGVGIVLGIYPKLAILLLVLFLLGTLYKMHRYWEVTDPMAKMGEEINFYKNLALIGALLMLLVIPEPWEMSLALFW